MGLALRPKVGFCAPGEGIAPYQSSLVGSPRPFGLSGRREPFPLRWLHILCAGCVFSNNSGSPPLLTGIISSTSKLIGCPGGSE